MTLPATQGSRTFNITATDHGGVVIAASTLLLTWMLLCFIIRIYNRLAHAAALGPDDLVCGAATVGNSDRESRIWKLTVR